MRLAALVLALAACADTAEPTDDDDKAVLAFRAQLAQLDRATTEYVERMDAANATTCVAVRNTYDLEVDPLVRIQMATLADDLDQVIEERGGAGFADLLCITAALQAELEAHVAAECTVDDIAAEAHRHGDAMAALLDAATTRADELRVAVTLPSWIPTLLTGPVFVAAPVACP